MTGHIAIARGRQVPRTGGMPWRPLFGTLLGYINVAVIVLLASSFFDKGRHCQDMAVCENNLKQIGMTLSEYENKNRGIFPPLSPQSGVLMFPAAAVPPKYEIAPLLTCPTIRYAKKPTTGSASLFDDQSYFYLGYALRNDDAVEAFAKAYRKRIAEGGTFDEDLVVEDGEGTHVLHRLSEGVREVLRALHDCLSVSPYEGRDPEYNVATAVCDDVPLLIERDLGHIDADSDGHPRGAHVLYLNNGVQYVERGTWPMTEKTQRILAELAK